MTYELLQQDPVEFYSALLISLVITVFAYGAFPVIFAKTRNDPITKKKYTLLCFGINFAVMAVFAVVSGGASSGAPYFLWTWVFSRYGVKTLGSRGVMHDSDYLKEDPNRIVECVSCGYRDKNYFDACPKCGKYAKRYVYPSEENAPKTDKVCFCRMCGAKLLDGSKFCRQCGTEVNIEV